MSQPEKYCEIHWCHYPESMGCKMCAARITREEMLKSRGVLPVISIRKENKP